MRSTSDVSEMIHEIARKRDNKEKRSKPYKSDPFGLIRQEEKPSRSYPDERYLMQNQCDKFHHLSEDLRFEAPREFSVCDSICDFTESDQKRRIKGGSSKEEVITFLHDVKKLGRQGQSLDEYISDDVSFLLSCNGTKKQSTMNVFFEVICFDFGIILT